MRFRVRRLPAVAAGAAWCVPKYSSLQTPLVISRMGGQYNMPCSVSRSMAAAAGQMLTGAHYASIKTAAPAVYSASPRVAYLRAGNGKLEPPKWPPRRRRPSTSGPSWSTVLQYTASKLTLLRYVFRQRQAGAAQVRRRRAGVLLPVDHRGGDGHHRGPRRLLLAHHPVPRGEAQAPGRTARQGHVRVAMIHIQSGRYCHCVACQSVWHTIQFPEG